MKAISDYTIYCTEAQTKKALELGATIELWSEYYKCQKHDFKLDAPIPCKQFTNGYTAASCPTAEQMIGFILESGRGYASDLSELIKEYGYKQGCLTFIDNCLK